MPQAVGMAAAYVYGAAAGIGGAAAASAAASTIAFAGMSVAALTGNAILMAASLGYGSYQKRRAKASYNDNLQDRTQTYRSASTARSYIYGQTRVGPLLTYAHTWGDKREKTSLVLTFAGHPITEFVSLYSSDQPLGLPDAGTEKLPGGSVLSKTVVEAKTTPEITAGGNGSQINMATYLDATESLERVDSVALIVPVRYQPAEGGWAEENQSITLVPPQGPGTPQWSISGNVITLTTAEFSGKPLVVTYRARRTYDDVTLIKLWEGDESDANLVDATLISASVNSATPWTGAHLGRGIARARATYTWDETVFNAGLPDLGAVIKGKKVYDPRLDSTNGGSGAHRAATESTWAWSENPALCIVDYMRKALDCTTTEIDWPSVAEAANICDEWVQCMSTITVNAVTKASSATVTTSQAHRLVVGDYVHFTIASGMTQLNTIGGAPRKVIAVPDGTTFTIDINSTGFSTFTSGTCYRAQKRFTLNGSVSTENDVRQNLEEMLGAMLGVLFYSGGKFYIRAASYRTPSLTLDESDLADGTITMQARASRADLFNSVKGKFRNARNLYVVGEFSQYTNSTYVTQDGNETIVEDIDMPFVDDEVAAQRIGKLLMHRARQAITFEATWKIYAYALQPADTVRVKLSRYGWDTIDGGLGKVFRVIDREFINLSTVKLVLQEEASDLYNWTHGDGDVKDPAANTDLPLPSVVLQPQNVTIRSGADYFYTRADGSIVPYMEISWDLPAARDVYVDVYAKRTADQRFQRYPSPPGATSMRIENPGRSETYNLWLIATNGAGATSPPLHINPYTTDPNTPASAQVPSLSANLLVNPSFEVSTDRWGIYTPHDFPVSVTKEVYYGFKGVPANARVEIATTLTGSDYGVALYSEVVTVNAGDLYAAYADLLPLSVTAGVAIDWYDGGLLYLSTSSGTYLAARAAMTGDPSKIEQYQRSWVFANAPGAARYARLLVYAGGPWTESDTFGRKFVFVTCPFLGLVPGNVTRTEENLPAWDAGASLVLGTTGLLAGAATDVIPPKVDTVGAVCAAVPYVIAKTIRADMVLDGPVVTSPVAAKMEVSVTFTIGASYATDGSARNVHAMLFRNGGDPVPDYVSMPVAKATGSSEHLVNVTMKHVFDVAANETVTPMLALNRTIDSVKTVAEKVAPAIATNNNTTDRVYGAVWSVVLIKR